MKIGRLFYTVKDDELDGVEPTSGWLYHPYSCDDVIGAVYFAVGTSSARTSTSDIVSKTTSGGFQLEGLVDH